MSFSNFSPKTGDIVSAYLPTHVSPGKPGEASRLNLVLGLEVDPATNRIEGLYLCRLSERTEKFRRWDYGLYGKDVTTQDDRFQPQDMVLRTPRIDLLPLTPEYFGEAPHVHGTVKSTVFEGLRRQLEAGQNSSFFAPSYGPRDKLAHCYVTTSSDSTDLLQDFDFGQLIDQAQENARTPQPLSSEPASPFQREFDLACKQQRLQCAEVRKQIHEEFRASLQTGRPWQSPVTGLYAPSAP